MPWIRKHYTNFIRFHINVFLCSNSQTCSDPKTSYKFLSLFYHIQKTFPHPHLSIFLIQIIQTFCLHSEQTIGRPQHWMSYYRFQWIETISSLQANPHSAQEQLDIAADETHATRHDTQVAVHRPTSLPSLCRH